VEFRVMHMTSIHENLVKFWWRMPDIVGKMSRFCQFCDFQEIVKVHRSQHSLCWGPLYLAQIFHNVCSFRLLFQICIVLCYSKVIRLESAKVSEKSRQNLHIFAPQNVGDTDRALSDLCYKITLHSDFLAKVPWDGVLRPWRLECKKVINKSQE